MVLPALSYNSRYFLLIEMTSPLGGGCCCCCSRSCCCSCCCCSCYREKVNSTPSFGLGWEFDKKDNQLTEHEDDMIPIVSNRDGGSCTSMLDKAVVLPSGHEDGLHHGDVEEGEKEDGHQEEDNK